MSILTEGTFKFFQTSEQQLQDSSLYYSMPLPTAPYKLKEKNITKTLQIFTLPMHTKSKMVIITLLTVLSHYILLAAFSSISFPFTVKPKVQYIQ
jgi:hypothetical protein